MPSRPEIGGYLIRPIETEREMNFVILDNEGYVCRLVPGLLGFNLSPLDLALGNTRALPLVPCFSEFIFQRDA